MSKGILRRYYHCVKEVTTYGFTQDNTKRAVDQRKAFQKACIDGVEIVKGGIFACSSWETRNPPCSQRSSSRTQRATFGKGSIKVHFLVNYGWQRDLQALTRWLQEEIKRRKTSVLNMLRFSDVSRIDLIMRWGGQAPTEWLFTITISTCRLLRR